MQMAKSKISKQLVDVEFASGFPGVIVLLLKDHEAMREIMAKIDSPRSIPSAVFKHFSRLEDLVNSHMAAEESALVNHLKHHPKFKDEALESYEEHRIHEHIFVGIKKLKNKERKLAQMKIYCEMLEHHLKEEEHDLFPQYKAYFALSSSKAAGKKFITTRIKTSTPRSRIGALAKRILPGLSS